jgi:hypothetical protein
VQQRLRRVLRTSRRLGAAVIALAAVSLTVWEGLENRRHNHLSVVPKIDAYRDRDMLVQRFELILASTGLGPAVVRDLRLYLDGVLIHDRTSDAGLAWQAAYPVFRDLPVDVTDAWFEPGDFLVPGEKYSLLRVERRRQADRITDFEGLTNRIDIAICYCSVYGDQCAIERLGTHDVVPPPCP